MSHTITILPGEKTLTAPDGINLLAFLRNAGLAPDAPCGGSSKCGKCRVKTDGSWQLACRTVIDRDMAVSLDGEQEQTTVLTAGAETAVTMDPVKDGYLLAIDIGTTTVAVWWPAPQPRARP